MFFHFSLSNFDNLVNAYHNIERNSFFQLFYKLLFFNDSFFVVSCFVLVIGDSFLIRSLKKFFYFGYQNALARVRLGVCVPGCACVRMRVCVRVCVREGGVSFVQHYGEVCYLCIPVAKMHQFVDCCNFVTLFCDILTTYQLVYLIKTVT